MRLGLIRVGVLAAALLATALALVPGASAAARPAAPRLQFSFQTHADGFLVEVRSIEMKGKQGVFMTIYRRHHFAEYGAPAQISESTVKAKFGNLGELDYSFAPGGQKSSECIGWSGRKASFTGTFNFTGENGFIHIDADRASGFYEVEPEPSGCPAGRSDRPAAPSQTSAGDGATLFARTSWTRARGVRRLREVAVGSGATVTAAFVEVRRGLSIVRGAEVNAPVHAFEWDLGTGTATLMPPAPFAGTATVTRGADGGESFTGSLRARILGFAKPIAFAGGGFGAELRRATPHES